MLLPEMEFLGHMVYAVGVKVAVDKVDAVSLWPTSTCMRDMQEFLGRANFYRRFLKGFSAIAKLLTNLTKKTTNFS